jgi:hypothetical protein
MRILYVPALLLVVPLLVGNRWPEAPRSFYAAWNQGHILFFALWTALLLRRYPNLVHRPLPAQLAVVLGFALIFGGLAEILQMLGGNGPPSLIDMSRNLLGALTGWTFFSTALTWRPPRYRWSGRVAVAGLIVISLLPLGRALLEEAAARYAFPLLAGFDQPFELDRWSGDARFQIAEPAFDPGNPMLEILFLTDHYSGVALKHFPRDWRGFSHFAFNTYNPEATPLDIVCRINDRRHNRDGYRYRDRFNRRLSLPPGWSQIRLSIDEIATALADRRMDLDDVLQVGIFTVSLTAPRTLYLDDVRLLP